VVRLVGQRRNFSRLAGRGSRRRRAARHHPTGEIGVVDGSVEGELGVGTSTSGVDGGDSLGASVGLPGSLGSGSSDGRGVSDIIILLPV
jgi:hypothetical protein